MSGIWRWPARHADFIPDKPALTYGETTWTWRQFEQRIGQAARLLGNSLGLKPGDVIGYLGLNSPDQLVLTFAAARCGVMITSVNWRLAAPEQAFVLKNAGVKALFVQDGLADKPDEIVPASAEGNVFGGRAFHSAWADVSGALPRAGTGDDPLLLVYTSGTTGEPKGAVLTQSAVLTNALNSVHMHEMVADDVVLTSLPMFHVGGLNIQTLPALYCGAHVLLHERFEPGAVLSTIREQRPSLMVQVPATLAALIGHTAFASTDFSCLRAITTGSTDVPVPLIEQMHGRGVPVIQVYGSTETGPVAIYQQPCEAMATTGSIGRAGFHCDIRLVDETGEDVADDEAGEIWVRGGNVAREYWQAPDASAASFADGWFRTGDVARKTADGLYWFTDRIKHVIISGGENIYPAELERVLRDIPGVVEAAVAGRADEKWGTVPVAVVAGGKDCPARDDILAAFNGKLARYKHPRDVVFVEALPRNVMGKVILDEVRALVA